MHSDVKKIAVYVKRIISYQGVNMPNCLHIVDYLHQKKTLDIVKLIQFILKSHSNNNNKAMQSFYSGLQSNINSIQILDNQYFRKTLSKLTCIDQKNYTRISHISPINTHKYTKETTLYFEVITI